MPILWCRKQAPALFSRTFITLSLVFSRDSVRNGFPGELSSLLRGLAGKFLPRYGFGRSLCKLVHAADLGEPVESVCIQSVPQERGTRSPHAPTPRTCRTVLSVLGQQVASCGAPPLMRTCRSHTSSALLHSVDEETVLRRTDKDGRASGRSARRKKTIRVLKGSKRRGGLKWRSAVAVKQPFPRTSVVLGSAGSRTKKRKAVLVGRKRRRSGAVLRAEAADRELIKQLCGLLGRATWDATEAQKAIRRLELALRPLHVCQVLKSQVEAEKALVLFRWAGDQKGYRHTPDVYFETLRILGDAGNFKMAWCLLDEIFHQEGTVLEGPLMTVVKGYLKFNLIDEALQAFSAMDKYGCKPSLSAWNLVLASLVAGNSQQAFELFQKMQVAGCFPNSRTYNLLIDSLGRDEKVDAAMNLFQDMKMRSCCPDVATYSILIALLGRSNKVDAAYDMFQEMLAQGCEPNVVVYNTVLDVLGKARKWHLVQTAFKQMAERGSIPDVWSYSILANCFGKAGKMEEAYKVFREVTLRGRYPNTVMFNTFIGNLGRMGQIDASLHLFEHMKQTGHYPCVVTYNTLISMLGKVGKTHQVDELFQEMKERGVVPSTRTYNSLLDAFRSSGQLDKVLQLFTEMKKYGHVPTVVTYTALVQTLGGTGNFAGALEILQEMDSQGCTPDEVLFRVLGKCLEQNGKWDVSRELSCILKTAGPVQTLRELPRILSCVRTR